MERCPCCNARLSGAVLCPRCKANLGAVINSEKAAQYWLSKAIQNWQESKTEQSFEALDLSLHLKKTRLALVFRDFLIQQQCQDILELLAQKKVVPAKQQLYKIRNFLPYSELLQQLQLFTEYLLVKKSKTVQPSHPVIEFVTKQLENRENFLYRMWDIVTLSNDHPRKILKRQGSPSFLPTKVTPSDLT